MKIMHKEICNLCEKSKCRPFECNKELVFANVPKKTIQLFDEIKIVLNIIELNLSNSNFYYDNKTVLPYCAGVSEILTSTQNTLSNILFIINNWGFADSFSLLRKVYDDLILSLLILKYIVDDNMDKKVNAIIIDFIKNSLIDNQGNLKSDYKYEFESKKFIIELCKNTQLKECYDKFFLPKKKQINRFLNNHVHTNGLQYVINNIEKLNYTSNIHDDLLNSVNYIAKYEANLFIAFSILLQPNCIMSSDYIDALDCGIQPEDGTQYFVASGIQDYMTKHMKPSLVTYLKVNNRYGMKIE